MEVLIAGSLIDCLLAESRSTWSTGLVFERRPPFAFSSTDQGTIYEPISDSALTVYQFGTKKVELPLLDLHIYYLQSIIQLGTTNGYC